MHSLNQANIFIPKNMNPYPKDFEISAAAISSHFFHTKVSFIQKSTIKTSDLYINGRYWEIKSPVGRGKHTIQNNLRKADNQSENIILDLRRLPTTTKQAIGRIKHEINRATKIKRLLIITKNQEIIVLLGKI